MKFQNPSIHHSKVNTQTDRHTDRQAESNMPFQLFQSWGHKNAFYVNVNVFLLSNFTILKADSSKTRPERYRFLFINQIHSHA